MKILWLAPYPLNPEHHPAPWIMMLAREIAGCGHQLMIVTPSSKIKEPIIYDSGLGYQITALPYQGGLVHLLTLFGTQIRAIRRYLGKYAQNYDIIHVHGTEIQLASSLIGPLMKTPFVISIQGIISLYLKALPEWLSKRRLYWTLTSYHEKREIRLSNYFFCRTLWDSRFVKQVNPAAVIFKCWELIRSEFFEYSHLFFGKDILFMGGDNPLKALRHCLRVFDQVAKGRDIKLHIVGSSDLKKILTLSSRMGLSELGPQNLIVHGRQDATGICRIYASCFCLYHPSLIDNSPNSVCEAQVAGLPVIATSVGGVPDLLEDGQTGLLVQKEDLEGHVSALEKLLDDQTLQRRLSDNARKLARNRHDKTMILERTISAYQNIINRTHA